MTYSVYYQLKYFANYFLKIFFYQIFIFSQFFLKNIPYSFFLIYKYYKLIIHIEKYYKL